MLNCKIPAKFQSFSAEKLFSTKSNKVNNIDVLNLFKSMELDKNWHKDGKSMAAHGPFLQGCVQVYPKVAQTCA